MGGGGGGWGEEGRWLGKGEGGFEGFAIIHLTGTAGISGEDPTAKFMGPCTDKKKEGKEGDTQIDIYIDRLIYTVDRERE